MLKPPNTSKPPPSQAQQLRPSNIKQFNSTPRFSLSQARRPLPPAHIEAPSPLGARLASTAFPSKRFEESIEDDNSTDAEEVHDSIETASFPEATNKSGSEDDLYEIDVRNPKRRRLSSLSIEDDTLEKPTEHNDSDSSGLSSSVPIISSPTGPSTQKQHSAAPRFILPSQAPLSTPHPIRTPIKTTLPAPTQDHPDTNTSPFAKPPRFRPQDPDVTRNIEPLPDAFSPHRRGQKYLPGGLASEVRDWLVNLESTASTRDRRTEWAVRIVVDEVKSDGGMVMVRGRQIHDVEDEAVDKSVSIKLILAGEGMMEGLNRSVVVVGGIIGIKGPMWEIFVKGERWGVGVEWKAL